MYRMLRNRYCRSLTWIVTLAFVATLIPTGLFAEPRSKKRQVVYGNSYKKNSAKPKVGKAASDVQPLGKSEMAALKGKGTLRNEYFVGTMPWHRSFYDVTFNTGNLFKSFTDVQVAPARGAGLVLQRTYNSQDDRIGPFGRGWTHAYDIRMKEAGDDNVDRVDFFGGRHTYKRDADGLYTPPPYSHDWMESDYNSVMTIGPTDVNQDFQTGLDGTKKHFILMGNERVIDYIEDRNGNRTTFTYLNDLLSTVTDPSGRELDFTWTNFGTAQNPVQRITQVEGPLQIVTYDYYDGTGQNDLALSGGELYNLKAVHLDPSGLDRTTTFVYTTFTLGNDTEYGLLASVEDPCDNVISYQYEYPPYNPTETVWVTRVIEPAGVDENNIPRTFLHRIYPDTDPGGRVWVQTWHPQTPTIQVVVDLDALGRTSSAGSIFDEEEFSYDSGNNVASKSSWSYCIEYMGRANEWRRTDNYTYGPHGHVLTHSITGFSGEDTYTYYDETKYFQKATVTDMEGNTSSFDYGATNDANAGNRGNVLRARDARYATTGREFTYTYNQYGQKTSETNLNLVETEYTYGDDWGNLTQVVQDPTAQQPRVTSMTYDEAGRVLSKTDPSGKLSEIDYNACGQPVTARFGIVNDIPEETVAYVYGDNGRIEGVTDNHGATSIGYETGSERVSTVNDSVTGTTTYKYFAFGPVMSKSLPGGGLWRYVPYVYPWSDPGEYEWPIASIHYESGGDSSREVSYSIDNKGNMWQARFDKQYDQFDNLTAYAQTDYYYDNVSDVGSGQQNTHMWLRKVKTTWHYDVDTDEQVKLLSQNEYTYDAVGNRLDNEITILDENNDESTRKEEYGYDDLYRLTSVDYDDGQTQGYTFDPMGNRTQKTDSVYGQEDYVYNNANMLLEREGNYYTNDANGNTLTGGGRTNVWDSQNRLYSTASGGTATSFTYGPDGLRRSLTANDTTTYYALDGQNVAREGHLSGQTFVPDATYLNGLRGTECQADDNTGQVRWYLFDGSGSVLGEIADPDGNNNPVKCTRKMDVYGAQRASSGTAQSNHKFSGSLGHSSDPTTGLIYMRARYMDPVTGRFVSEDPVGDGFNWYNYCDNSPVNRVDPTGQMAVGGELDYDITVVRAGFGAIAYVLGIIAAYNIRQILTVNRTIGDFVMTTNTDENKKFDDECKKRGVDPNSDLGRSAHDLVTGEGLSKEEIGQVIQSLLDMSRGGAGKIKKGWR